MFLQRKASVFDILWTDGVTYGELRREDERQLSAYGFEHSDPVVLRGLFETYEAEARRLLEVPLVLPAYEAVLKCSHLFNLLDACGAVGVTQRVELMGRTRALARACALAYLKAEEQRGDEAPHA
jgi:glycyl-tRNA synthetase alpha chain